MQERQFQARLIKKIKSLLPDAIVMKTDPNYIQGFPDLLILNDDRWAALEVKRASDAHRQPNQEYYIQKLGEMSYAGFIHPENEEEILHEVQRALTAERSTRVSERERISLD